MGTFAELHERWSQDPEYREHAGPDSPAKPDMLACRRWRHHPQRDHLRLIETELHQRTHMVVPLLTIRHRGSRTEWRGSSGSDSTRHPPLRAAPLSPRRAAPRLARLRAAGGAVFGFGPHFRWFIAGRLGLRVEHRQVGVAARLEAPLRRQAQ